MPRRIVWFSCGAPSAVAAKLTVQEHPDCVVAYCDTGGEHEDNARFLKDVEKWIKKDVEIIKNGRYRDHQHVAEKDGYINGPSGARCTLVLKRRVRAKFQRHDDIHIWGYTSEEVQRAADFEENNPELKCAWPLIEAGLSKTDCLGLIHRAGIEIPTMYKLGYANNNCVACWKGGMGYWNKIRVDFPERFAEAARICRVVGRSPIKDKKGNPIFLDELDPNAGRDVPEPSIECGLVCNATHHQITENDL